MKKLISIALFFAAIQVQAETATIEIGGMSCGNCIKKVTKNLCQKDMFETCDVQVGKAVVTTKKGEKVNSDFVKAALESEDGHYKLKNIVVSQ